MPAERQNEPLKQIGSVPSARSPTVFDRSMPPLFVVIWGTGFIVARFVAPHAEPLTFLLIRFALSTLVFSVVAMLVGARWPRSVRGWRDALISGVLLQGVYLGCVFWSARHGLPAGLSALIGGLQPVLTAALAGPLLGEAVGSRRWLGIGFGFAGALLVLLPKLGMTSGVPPVTVAVVFVGTVGITIGTIWQKGRAAGVDLRTNAAIQFLGAMLVTAPIAALTEGWHFDGSWQVWLGLLWSVFGLSVGAISLLLILIKRGAVAGVASLFYLVPPVVATMAFLVFGEHLTAVQIFGMAVAVLGVALASRPEKSRRS